MPKILPARETQAGTQSVGGFSHARLKRAGRRRLQRLNIHDVIKQSSPSTASEATTTVWGVARDTPSGVGCDSKP